MSNEEKNTEHEEGWFHFEEQNEGKYLQNYFVPIDTWSQQSTFQIISRDITEQHQLEENLRSLNQEYEIIMDNVQSGIFLIDIDSQGQFRLERFNTCQEQLTGLHNEDIRDKTPVQVLGEELGQEVTRNYQQCLQRQESIN